MSFRRNPIEEGEIQNFYSIINQTGFGTAQIWILLCSSFLVMHVFTELMGMAVIGPAAQCDLEMNDVHKSILHSAGFLGVTFSSFYWSVLTDVKGRKWVLGFSTCMATATAIISSIMPNYVSFVTMRFFVGIFVAGSSFAAVTYLVEFCPYRHRTIIINYMAMFNGFGMIHCPALAEWLLCNNWNWIYDFGIVEYRPWRFMILLYSLPGILGLLLLWKLPESPEFALCARQKDEVNKVLLWIYRLNSSEPVELVHLPVVKCVNRANSERGKVLHLLHLESWPNFQKTYLLPFSLSCFMVFALCSVGNGLGIWFTDLRNRQVYEIKNAYPPMTVCQEMTLKMGLSIKIEPFVCNDRVRTYRDSILLGLGFIAIYNITGLLLHWISRKYILISSLLIAGCCGIGLLTLRHEIAIVVVFILLLAIPNVLINLVVSTVMDYTSAHVRSKIVCICYMLGRIGAIQGSILVGTLINSHCELVFIVLTTLLFTTIIATWFLYHILEKHSIP